MNISQDRSGAVEEGVAPAQFRQLMRTVASSVAVITSAHDGQGHGMTATAVVSICAEPPTVLIAVNRSTRSHPFIAGSGAFVINILAEHQKDVSDRFAGALDDQFAGLEVGDAWRGIPVLLGVAAHLFCQVTDKFDVGTHTVFLGRVIDGHSTDLVPLLYHDGNYKNLLSRSSPYDVASMFLSRWSPRAFEDAEIDDTTLMTFFEAAHWAPSSMNEQPWRFVHVRPGGQNWEPVLSTLSRTNRSWARKAAALIIFISRKTMEYEGKSFPSPTHAFDTGAAWMSFALQAELKGWHTHGMSAFDHEALARAINLPEDFHINAVIAVGKIGNPDDLPEALANREFPSGRRPVAEFVSADRFTETMARL